MITMFVIVAVSLILGIYVGYRTVAFIFSKKTYTTANAFELLKIEKPEQWNELRIMVPDWLPDLTASDLSHRSLPGTNLRDAKLDKVNFESSDLEGADFSRASLRGADFTGASVERACFDSADLEEATFKNTLLKGVSLKNANLQRTDPSSTDILDATEPIDLSVQDIINLVVDDPQQLYELQPQQFEELVAAILESSGYEVQSPPRTYDHGFDLFAWGRDPIDLKTLYIVETKAYKKGYPVGIGPVRALKAAKLSESADQAMLVTTSTFSQQAKTIAAIYGNIELVDYERLVVWIQQVKLQQQISHKESKESEDGRALRQAQPKTTGAFIWRIPQISNISAGLGYPIAEENVVDYVNLREQESIEEASYFVLVVDGDSMTGDGIFAGDKVLIRQQEGVENGDIAAVVINTPNLEEPLGTLKRYYSYERKGREHWFLKSSNPAAQHLVVVPPDTDVAQIRRMYAKEIQAGKVRLYQNAELSIAGKYIRVVEKA